MMTITLEMMQRIVKEDLFDHECEQLIEKNEIEELVDKICERDKRCGTIKTSKDSFLSDSGVEYHFNPITKRFQSGPLWYAYLNKDYRKIIK